MTTDPATLKQKSVTELFADAINAENDEDSQWAAVSTLRDIATPEVFQTAVDFCKSESAIKREKGLDVLAQFGVSMKDHVGPFFEERLAIALEHLQDEAEKVVASAAWALAHMHDERAKKGLLTIRRHPDAKARHAVATGLNGETSPEAASALMELMQDTQDYVRDWATFSLGRTASLDSPQIRDAFRNRLNDSDVDAQHEAVWGLAVRKDLLGVQLLLKNLEADEWWSGDQDAAVEVLNVPSNTPVPELREGLRKLLIELETKNCL